MDTPFLTWICILAVVIFAIIIDAVRAYYSNARKATHRHLISIGKERELFFIPGDPDPRKPEVNDYDDIEDY